jgi:hypothetical protein
MWIIAGFSLVVLWCAVRSGQSRQAAQQCADLIKTLGSSGVDARMESGDVEVAP